MTHLLPFSRHSHAAHRASFASRVALAATLLTPVTAALNAADLVIHLPSDVSISRKTVQYQCDANGPKIGVPSGPFTAEYINGGGNSLVIVPISGNSLVFSNVIAASGARYTAQQYTWWDAGGQVTLSADSIAGKTQSTCQRTGK